MLRRAGSAAALVAFLAAAALSPVPARADSGVARAQAELEDSSAAVRAAGVALAHTAVALPAAQREAARARGEVAGAQARVAEAQRAVRAGELLLAAARARVEQANAALTQTREQLGRLARRSYTLGPLQALRTITEGGPEDFLERTELLEQAFKGNDEALRQVTVDRLAVAQQLAELDAAQATLDAAQAHGQPGCCGQLRRRHLPRQPGG